MRLALWKWQPEMLQVRLSELRKHHEHPWFGSTTFWLMLPSVPFFYDSSLINAYKHYLKKNSVAKTLVQNSYTIVIWLLFQVLILSYYMWCANIISHVAFLFVINFCSLYCQLKFTNMLKYRRHKEIYLKYKLHINITNQNYCYFTPIFTN